MAHDDKLTYDDLLRIVELIKSSERFTEFRLKVGDIEVELRRRAEPAPAPPSTPRAAGEGAPTDTTRSIADTPNAAADAPTPGPRGLDASQPVWPADALVVRAPMIGTFYRAPEPGAVPFVEPGQAVSPDTIVCIIEVMKLMNSIPAGARGTVTHILVEDATAVEAGQPLIVVQPDAGGP